MRVLLDECVPRKLKHHLKGYFVSTVVEAGWSGKKNGELLRLAEVKFDVFITVDQNLEYQHNLGRFNIVIIFLVARDNDVETLRPFFSKI